MISLKKTLTGVLVATGLLLILVLILGLIQQRITNSYVEVIDRGEKIVFRFNSLRDLLTGYLFEHKWERFNEASVEIEAINKDLRRLLDNPIVPPSYKLTLADRVDPQGIALLARKLAAEGDKTTLALKLHERLRITSDQLLRLERVLAGQMNDRLIQFQKMAIGALTLITGIIGLLLIVLYRMGLRPLLILCRHLNTAGDISAVPPMGGACREINQLAKRISTLTSADARSSQIADNPLFIARTVNRISNLLNGIINYSQLLIDECSGQGNDQEHTAMLEKIITHSEQISSLLKREDQVEESTAKPVLAVKGGKPAVSSSVA